MSEVSPLGKDEQVILFQVFRASRPLYKYLYYVPYIDYIIYHLASNSKLTLLVIVIFIGTFFNIYILPSVRMDIHTLLYFSFVSANFRL